MFNRILIFLIINFSALALGGIFTSAGVPSSWYQNLSKAPWTPPGWVFGTAWTIIMFSFSFYVSYWWEKENRKKFILLVSLQWILNVIWNPIFFTFHLTFLSLVIISLLTILLTYIGITNRTQLGFKSLLILPYLLWLFIATSLNAYITYCN